MKKLRGIPDKGETVRLSAPFQLLLNCRTVSSAQRVICSLHLSLTLMISGSFFGARSEQERAGEKLTVRQLVQRQKDALSRTVSPHQNQEVTSIVTNSPFSCVLLRSSL